MFALLLRQEGVKVENSKFVRAAKDLDNIIKTKSAVKVAQDKGGMAMYNNARFLVPVRTGNLRENGIKLEKTENGFVFYVDENAAPYGKHVEKGTRRMRAQPFFWPSVDANIDSMLQAVIQHYKRRRRS